MRQADASDESGEVLKYSVGLMRAEIATLHMTILRQLMWIIFHMGRYHIRIICHCKSDTCYK